MINPSSTEPNTASNTFTLLAILADFCTKSAPNKPVNEVLNKQELVFILVMKKYINKLKNNGSIIVISSHILEFVAKITNNIVFIKDGTIVRKINSECNLEQIYTDIYL
ncbi:hypothetical protein [Clostridium estertheticum]|uniref:hypothetical protein n=1 Tax=Clostridium estertheticum TaxID=238834 RepID=UPI002714F0CA|nr:hypothetical protein [Clostridium estertheticum]